MKRLLLILPFYLLLVSFTPCCSNDDCDSDSLSITEKKMPVDEDDCKDDHCSPFCACYCNPVQCSDEIKDPVPALPIIISKNIPVAYIQNFISVYCGNIWQPPKSKII